MAHRFVAVTVDHDPVRNLIASVAKLAVIDAEKGDQAAAEWINEVLPEWRRYAGRHDEGSNYGCAVHKRPKY